MPVSSTGLTNHVKRLNLFVKGNVDVHDSLHSCRIGSELVWNGVNEILRLTHPGCLARIRHETWNRSDALLQAEGRVPDELALRHLPLGAYPEESQFSRAIFESKADAIILSTQPDIAAGLMRHRREGFLFYANDHEAWNPADRQWLQTEFEATGRLEVAQSMANFEAIIVRIRERSEAPILIYNLSAITPGETIHCHLGLGEAYSTRIRRFNLGLIELSERTGISIIDVDSLLARQGADGLKLDMVHLTPAGYRLVAEEVVRVLGESGLLDD